MGALPEDLNEFDVAETLHIDCEGCADEAVSAAILAKSTGSVGARSERGDGTTIEHSARVVRVRCKGRDDCCCSIHLAARA